MATRIALSDFRKRFPTQQSPQPFATGLYGNMMTCIDQERKAEVVLRTMVVGADPRPRSTKATPDRMVQLRDAHLISPFEAIRVDADPADPGSRPMDVLLFLPNQGESLEETLRKSVSREDKIRLVEGILDGLEALHAQGITHGNLKPSNVLVKRLPEAHAALCDYGYGEWFDFRNAILQWPADQLAYLAPEQLSGQGVGPNLDFWALGMLVYRIFLGQYLFGSQFSNNTELVARIESANLPQDIFRIPEPYQRLAVACLNRDPKQRPAKVAQLRDLIAGKILWKDGRPVPVVQQTPPPRDVICRACGQANSPNRKDCVHCGSPLQGPSFLHRYRSSNSLAIWTLVWFAMFMLPIGFFYYGLYEVEKTGVENQGLYDKATQVIEWYQKIAPAEHASSDYNYNREELSPQEKVVTVIALAFGCYFFIFGSLWMLFQMLWTWRVSNNLYALGAPHRRYHPGLMLLSVGLFLGGALGTLAFPPIALLAFPLATILPLLTLQEVWRGSNPTYLQTNGGWQKAKGSFMIFSWWLLSLVFPVLLVLPLLPVEFLLKMGFEWSISLNWFFVTIGILAAYCVMYAVMLLRVNYRQARKYSAWQGG